MSKLKTVILVVFLVSLIVATTTADCLCGAQGDDYCSCSQRIVRPQPLQRIDSRPRQVCRTIGGAQQFQPIGDSCSCNSMIVQPAQQPAPCQASSAAAAIDAGTQTAAKPPCSCGQSIRAPDAYQGADILGAEIYDMPAKRSSPVSAPADPVSLSLAYRAAQQAAVSVPEEGLQYGFRKLPTNQPAAKNYPNIDEEKLQAIDRTVVELKPMRQQQSEDDEEQLDELDEFDEETDRQPSHLGLADIGYLPALSHEPKFQTQRCGQPDSPASCSDSQPLEPVGNCGFRRGELVVDPNQQRSPAIGLRGGAAAPRQRQILNPSRVIEVDADSGYGGYGYDRFRRHSDVSELGQL